jgi:hypothetical protein
MSAMSAASLVTAWSIDDGAEAAHELLPRLQLSWRLQIAEIETMSVVLYTETVPPFVWVRPYPRHERGSIAYPMIRSCPASCLPTRDRGPLGPPTTHAASEMLYDVSE